MIEHQVECYYKMLIYTTDQGRRLHVSGTEILKFMSKMFGRKIMIMHSLLAKGILITYITRSE